MREEYKEAYNQVLNWVMQTIPAIGTQQKESVWADVVWENLTVKRALL